MHDEYPRISIIVPTYNRAHLLPRLFHSLLRQNDRRFELVIVDDGSTDSTPAVIEDFNCRFGGRLISVRHPDNRGVNAARNSGIRVARTAWCLFVDSDWELFPDSIQRAIYHSDLPQPVAAVTFLILQLPQNRAAGYRAHDQTWETAVIPPEDVVGGQNVTDGSFWMVRKSVFCDLGMWFPEWVNGMEYIFAARLSRRRQILAVRRVLAVAHFDPAEDHISLDWFRKWPNEFARGFELFIAENYDILRYQVQPFRALARRLALCKLYSGSYRDALLWAWRGRTWKVHRLLIFFLQQALRWVRCSPRGRSGGPGSRG